MNEIVKYRNVFFSIVFLLFLFLLFSDNSKVIVKLKYPSLNKVNLNSVWKLTKIINLSQIDYTVYLHGVVSINNWDKNILLWDACSSPFILVAGYSADSIDISILKPVKGHFNPKFQDIKENLAKTGTLPDGTYMFCVYIMEQKTNQELASDCIQITVSHFQRRK